MLDIIKPSLLLLNLHLKGMLKILLTILLIEEGTI